MMTETRFVVVGVGGGVVVGGVGGGVGREGFRGGHILGVRFGRDECYHPQRIAGVRGQTFCCCYFCFCLLLLLSFLDVV
ncbi:hypothetical protein QBC44DRAFT_335749 [Cladorrhinum sp. PSN332]|nr:hypothetical protein QBC44DRAFT_335749 [Cladorrhinum sp. PSN332]